MLSPENRTVAMDMLRPPAGRRLDQAVLTTYCLDLEVLLALPLAVLAQSDGGLDELLTDPLLLLEALREAGDRIHVFVDEAGIAIPRTNRDLYALLENSVHPVRAANGGAFHPKVWFVRFIDEDGQPLIRIGVSSRNLTFDRCWDVALVSDGTPAGRRAIPESRPLRDLLLALPHLTVRGLSSYKAARLQQLAADIARTAFPAPERFHSPIAFHALGLTRSRKTWRPDKRGQNLLAVAPFVNVTGLNALADNGHSERTLISRREALDDLPEKALSGWNEVLVLSDAAASEPEDGVAARPSGLHAKMIVLEHAKQVTWFVGSANLTSAAFTGPNVEMMASITGPRGSPDSDKGCGLERFREAGFLKLCEPYSRSAKPPEDPELSKARSLLEQARRALLTSNLRLACGAEDGSWRWTLCGDVDLPPAVSVTVWPISVSEDQGRTLRLPLEWSLPLSRLTTFVAIKLGVSADVDNIRLVLKLPAEGMPEGRVAQVLRTLIDSPERFLQFLRALLGGIEGLADWAAGDGEGAWKGTWQTALNGETLLEDLVRTASRDPKRLEPVRRLIEDLRSTPEGRGIVPDDLYSLWQIVNAAIGTKKARPKALPLEARR